MDPYIILSGQNKGMNRNKGNRYKSLILAIVKHEQLILVQGVDSKKGQLIYLTRKGSFQVILYKMIRFLSGKLKKHTKLAKIVKISIFVNRLVFPTDSVIPPDGDPPGWRTHPPWDGEPPPPDGDPPFPHGEPPRDLPPPLGKQTSAYGLRAAGTHPTGMHTCLGLDLMMRLTQQSSSGQIKVNTFALY